MRFKYFISTLNETNTEIRPSTIINKDSQVVSFLKEIPESIFKIASDIGKLDFSDRCFIFRGVYNSLDKPFFIKSSINEKQPRISANTTNECNLLMSEVFESWEKFPIRNQSFICSTDYNNCLNFGDVYFVIPLYDYDIGVCSDYDLWDSFEKTLGKHTTVASLNSSIQRLIKMNKFKNSKEALNTNIKFTKKDDLIHELKNVEKSIKENKFSNDYIKQWLGDNEFSNFWKVDDIEQEIIYQVKNNKSILNFLEELLNPYANGFKIMKYSDFYNKRQYTNREVWFSGEALFVSTENETSFKNIIKSME